MMKTAFPTNAELPIRRKSEDRRGGVTQDHHDNCAALAFLFKKVGQPTGPIAAH
jgi:hypothetical protein